MTAGKAEAAAVKKEAQAWRDKTSKQKNAVDIAIESLETRATELAQHVVRHDEQSGHLKAYYEEIQRWLSRGTQKGTFTELMQAK